MFFFFTFDCSIFSLFLMFLHFSSIFFHFCTGRPSGRPLLSRTARQANWLPLDRPLRRTAPRWPPPPDRIALDRSTAGPPEISLFFPSFRSFSLWGSFCGIVAVVQGHGHPTVRVWAPCGCFAKPCRPLGREKKYTVTAGAATNTAHQFPRVRLTF